MELNARILDLTMQIRKASPELSKYIAEIPMEVSNAADFHTRMQEMEAYLDTLHAIFHRYVQNHPGSGEAYTREDD